MTTDCSKGNSDQIIGNKILRRRDIVCKEEQVNLHSRTEQNRLQSPIPSAVVVCTAVSGCKNTYQINFYQNKV